MSICGTFEGSARVGAVGQQVELGRYAFAAAQQAPRPVAMAFAFDRGTAVAQERELAHRARAAAPLASAGHVLAQPSRSTRKGRWVSISSIGLLRVLA
jgi:hypothetical protein